MIPPILPSQASASSTGGPRWARWFTIASIAVAVIALVVSVTLSGPRTIFDQLLAIGPWFAVVIAIEIAGTLCDAAALRCYAADGRRRLPYAEVLRAHIAGRAVSLVTPLGGLGEVTKTTTLMSSVSSERAIAAVARWNLTSLAISLVAIVVGAPVCAAKLDLPIWLAGTLYIGAALSAVVLVVGVTLIRRGMLSSLVGVLAGVRLISARRRQAWRRKLRSIDHLVRGGRGLGHRSVGPAPVGWLLLSRVINYAGVWVTLAAMGRFAGVGTMAAMATAGTVIAWASTIVPFGLGFSEGGNATLFVALGFDAALGVSLVMTRRVIQLLYAAVGLSFFATTGTIQRARAFQQARASREMRAVSSSGTTAAAFPRAS